MKTLPWCYLQTYIEESAFSWKKTPAATTPNPLWCCSNEGHGFFHSRKKNLSCLKNALAFFGPNQAHNLSNIFCTNVLSNMNTGNGVQSLFLVGCHPYDSHLAIQFVHYCKWLVCVCVCVASLLAPKPYLLLFFVLNGLDIVKTLPGCYLQTYVEESAFSCKKKHRQQQHPIPFDAVATKATASFIRETITQAVWKMLWHFQV